MHTLAIILSIIGAVNWGMWGICLFTMMAWMFGDQPDMYCGNRSTMVGFCQFVVVAWLFGGQTGLVSRIIYTLVGLAGLWCVSLLFRRHNRVGVED